MTDHDLERRVTDWLHSDVSTAGADRVLATALVRVASTEQAGRRRPTWPQRARIPDLRAMAVVVAVLALLGLSTVPIAVREPLGGASSPADLPHEGYLVGTRHVNVDGIPLSLSAPEQLTEPVPLRPAERRWTGFRDSLYLSQNAEGPQAAEGMILFTSFPDSFHAWPCLLPADLDATTSELAEAVATAPGTELVSGPSSVAVGGRPAEHVTVDIVQRFDDEGLPDSWHPGCEPAYFFGWDATALGAMWPGSGPGDTIDMWFVRVGARTLVIEAAVSRFTTEQRPALREEIAQIVGSIRIPEGDFR